MWQWDILHHDIYAECFYADVVALIHCHDDFPSIAAVTCPPDLRLP
jgi:hypothetical protein